MFNYHSMHITRNFLLSALLLGGFIALGNGLSGCASGAGSVNPPAADTNAVKFTTTATASYRQDSLVMSNGTEQTKATGTTIAQSTVSTTSTIALHANSTVMQNVYTNSSWTIPTDSDYYYQDTNDDLYKLDFGLEPLNNIAALQAIIGGKVHVGWVLELKLGAAAGTTWQAISDTITAGSLGQVILKDNGTMRADTTIMVGTKAYRTRHAHHSFTGTASLGTAYGEFDVFYSPELASTVLVQIHPLSYTTALGTGGTQAGIQNVLTAHN